MRRPIGAQAGAPANTGRQSARPPHISFRIGRVTLHGYAPGDRTRFTNALQASLAEFARANGNSVSELKISRLDAGELRPGASPEEAARQVAARLFERIHG